MHFTSAGYTTGRMGAAKQTFVTDKSSVHIKTGKKRLNIEDGDLQSIDLQRHESL